MMGTQKQKIQLDNYQGSVSKGWLNFGCAKKTWYLVTKYIIGSTQKCQHLFRTSLNIIILGVATKSCWLGIPPQIVNWDQGRVPQNDLKCSQNSRIVGHFAQITVSGEIPPRFLIYAHLCHPSFRVMKIMKARFSYPMCSMYGNGISTYMYPLKYPNAGKYTLH